MTPEQLMTLAGFGALLCIPVALNYIASRHDYREYVDAFFASVMIAAIWSFTNGAAAFWSFPDSKQFHPLVDLIGLSVCIAAYMTQRQRWKLVLACLFLAQLYLHVGFWWTWGNSPLGSIGRDYIVLLNVLWAAQLVCVGWPGGKHAVLALSRLRDHRSLSGLARH